MALATTDFSKVRQTWLGPNSKRVTGIWTGPASYASGGEDFTRAIVKSALGLSELRSLSFTPLAKSDGTMYPVAFDHVTSATSQGKAHVGNAVAAHTHSFLVKGGTAAAGTDAINIKGTTPVTIGKEAATDATNIGGAGGGVQTLTAITANTEIAAATNLSTYSARFVAEGS